MRNASYSDEGGKNLVSGRARHEYLSEQKGNRYKYKAFLLLREKFHLLNLWMCRAYAELETYNPEAFPKGH